MTNQKCIDTPSQRQRFGWERIGEDLAIPVIIRTNNVRYCPTRIVEQVIIKKYATLPQNVFTCITLKSFYLTATEARLLTEINANHCNQYYGADFFSIQDVIISASDVMNLSRYLNVAKKMYSKEMQDINNYYGLIKIVVDPTNPSYSIVVPYIRKSYNNGQNSMFVPSKLVDSFVDITNISVKGHPTEWDVMYYKMLHYFSGNSAQLELTTEDRIIPINDSRYAKTGTTTISHNCDQ